MSESRMPYQQQIETCFASAIGEGGLTEDAYRPLLEATLGGLEELRRRPGDGGLPLLGLARAEDDLAAIRPIAARLRHDFERILVLATGGSSLGGQALAGLIDHAARPPAGVPRLDFLDNLDPHSLAGLMATLELDKTGFLAISKSGATVETIAQTLVCLEALMSSRGEESLKEQFVIITEPGDNPMRRLARRFRIQVVPHDPGIVGRFSVLSVVGLLPALILGLDVVQVREGAAQALDASLGANSPAESAPAVGAALQVALSRHKGVRMSVLMPYADRLRSFAMWHRQLWAESLGKNGLGLTPVPALGPVDQHSQLQLYLDGPADKMFTLIAPRLAGRGPRLDGALSEDAEIAPLLHGRSVGDLVDAEVRATAETLASRGRPTRIIRVDQVDERTLGALFMHFMLETILAARLLGVEAFDQPAVEEGKALARRYLEERHSP